MRRVIAAASNRGGLGPSLGPALGGWRPMSTEGGEAAAGSGAGRGRGAPLDQPGAPEAPGAGAGRGKVGAGSLFSRILADSKPKERPRRIPVQAKAGEGSAPREKVSVETGPDGTKLYRSRARPSQFADADGAGGEGGAGPQGGANQGRGQAIARPRRARIGDDDLMFDSRSQRSAQGRPQGGQQRRSAPGGRLQPPPAVLMETMDADFFDVPDEWRQFARLATDENVSFQHLGTYPLSWEEARALRKQREAADPVKHLEEVFPRLTEMFGVGEEQLRQLAQVAVAEHARERSRDPAGGLDVKEQEEALRAAMGELRGPTADARAAPAAEKLLHALEHNQHIPYNMKKRMVEKFADITHM